MVGPSEQSVGLGRRPERPLWIDLCGDEGVRYALPYRDMRSIEMLSSQTITLEFFDRRVIVRGRNLEPVYDALVNERVVQLREDHVDWAPESETFISKLTVERLMEHE